MNDIRRNHLCLLADNMTYDRSGFSEGSEECSAKAIKKVLYCHTACEATSEAATQKEELLSATKSTHHDELFF